MLCYCQLDPSEQTSVKFQLKYKTFIHENASENIVYEIAAILPREDELRFTWQICIARQITLKIFNFRLSQSILIINNWMCTLRVAYF